MMMSSVQLSLQNLIVVVEVKVKTVSSRGAVNVVDNPIYQQLFKISLTLLTSCRFGVNSFSEYLSPVLIEGWIPQSDAS